MNRYKTLYKTIDLISLAISIVSAERIEQAVEKVLIGGYQISILITLGVITIGKELLPFIFMFIIEESFLKKLILNRQYVDGIWLDAMIKDSKIVDIGKSHIEINEEGVCYSGFDFTAQNGAKAQGYYTSIFSKFEWPIFKYAYFYHNSSLNSESSGTGELIFIARKGIPLQYIGFYRDSITGDKTEFEGWRVTDKKIIRQLDNPITRDKAIKEFFQNHPYSVDV